MNFLQTIPAGSDTNLTDYPLELLKAWAIHCGCNIDGLDSKEALALALNLKEVELKCRPYMPFGKPNALSQSRRWRKQDILAWCFFLQCKGTSPKMNKAQLTALLESCDTGSHGAIWLVWPDDLASPEIANTSPTLSPPPPPHIQAQDKSDNDDNDKLCSISEAQLQVILEKAFHQGRKDSLGHTSADHNLDNFLRSRSSFAPLDDRSTVGFESAEFCLYRDPNKRTRENKAQVCGKTFPCGDKSHILGHIAEFGKRGQTQPPAPESSAESSSIPDFKYWRGGDEVQVALPNGSLSWLQLNSVFKDRASADVPGGSPLSLSADIWRLAALDFKEKVHDSGDIVIPQPKRRKSATHKSIGGPLGLAVDLLPGSSALTTTDAAQGNSAGTHSPAVIARVLAQLQTVTSVPLTKRLVQWLLNREFRYLWWRDFLPVPDSYEEGEHRKEEGEWSQPWRRP